MPAADIHASLQKNTIVQEQDSRADKKQGILFLWCRLYWKKRMEFCWGFWADLSHSWTSTGCRGSFVEQEQGVYSRWKIWDFLWCCSLGWTKEGTFVVHRFSTDQSLFICEAAASVDDPKDDFAVRLHYFGRFQTLDGLLQYTDGLEVEFFVDRAKLGYEHFFAHAQDMYYMDNYIMHWLLEISSCT